MLTSATSILESATVMQGWNKSRQCQLLLEFIQFSQENPNASVRTGGILDSLYLFLNQQKKEERKIEKNRGKTLKIMDESKANGIGKTSDLNITTG